MGYLVFGGKGTGESGVVTWRTRNLDGSDAGMFDLNLNTWNGWANGVPPQYTQGAALSADGTVFYIGGGESPIELGAFTFPDLTPLVAMSNITANGFSAPTDQYAKFGLADDGSWIIDQYENDGRKWDLDTGLTGVSSVGNAFVFGPYFKIPGRELWGYTRTDTVVIYDAGTSGALTVHLSKVLGFTGLKAIFPIGLPGNQKLAAFTSNDPGTTYLIDPDTGAETTDASGPGTVNRPNNSQTPGSDPDSSGGVLCAVAGLNADPIYVDANGACTTVTRDPALPSDSNIRSIVYASDVDQFVVIVTSFTDSAVYLWVLDASNFSTVSISQDTTITDTEYPWRVYYVAGAAELSEFWTTFNLSQEII